MAGTTVKISEMQWHITLYCAHTNHSAHVTDYATSPHKHTQSLFVYVHTIKCWHAIGFTSNIFWKNSWLLLRNTQNTSNIRRISWETTGILLSCVVVPRAWRIIDRSSVDYSWSRSMKVRVATIGLPMWGRYGAHNGFMMWVLGGFTHLGPMWVLHGIYGPQMAHVQPIWAPDTLLSGSL